MLATAQSYGLPPSSLPAMTAGASPLNLSSPVTVGTPAWHFVVPAYGVVLLIVAGLYGYSVLRRR